MGLITKMNERACIEEHLIDANPEAVFFDGLDDAIIGMAYRYNDDPLVAYSQERIIEILSRDMEHEDAVEYFDFPREYLLLRPMASPHTPTFPPRGLLRFESRKKPQHLSPAASSRLPKLMR